MTRLLVLVILILILILLCGGDEPSGITIRIRSKSPRGIRKKTRCAPRVRGCESGRALLPCVQPHGFRLLLLIPILLLLHFGEREQD